MITYKSMADKLTKAELIEALSSKTNLKRKDIHEFINSFFDEMNKSLLSGKIVELRGFGTFALITRKGRHRARNPRTGEIVSVEDHGVIRFRAGKELKSEAWEKK
jgi:integration host factor subunit beta